MVINLDGGVKEFCNECEKLFEKTVRLAIHEPGDRLITVHFCASCVENLYAIAKRQ